MTALSALKTLPKAPLLTLWPCFTEAMYLLGREGGYTAQAELLKFLRNGAVHLCNPDNAQAPLLENRMCEIMGMYRDIPCDFADAAVVAFAEMEQIRTVFTFERHFYAYRTEKGETLEVVPP